MKRKRRQRQAFITTTATRRHQCPVCQTWHDAVTGTHLDNEPTSPHPQPGCVTICATCATILVFEDTETGLRVAQDADIARLDPDAQRIVRELQRVHVFRPRH